MLQRSDTRQDDDAAEAEFRRRLAVKLAARGYPADAIPAKIEDLLRSGVGLKLDVDHILGRAAADPR